MATIRERLITSLLTLGEKVVPSTSEKYVKVTRTVNIKTRQPLAPTLQTFYWVGANGALRVGKTSSESASITGTGVYELLLESPIDASFLLELLN